MVAIVDSLRYIASHLLRPGFSKRIATLGNANVELHNYMLPENPSRARHVVSHGDPLDVLRHQAQGARCVAGGQLVVEVSIDVVRIGGHGSLRQGGSALDGSGGRCGLARRGGRAAAGFSAQVPGEELAHGGADLAGMGFQGEVAAVDEADVRTIAHQRPQHCYA